MTLLSNNISIPCWRKSEPFFNKNRKFTLEKGIDNTGDLYNPKNFDYCFKKYKNSMNFITGDGGFDFSIDYNKQELLAFRLIFTQISYAIAMHPELINSLVCLGVAARCRYVNNI